MLFIAPLRSEFEFRLAEVTDDVVDSVLFRGARVIESGILGLRPAREPKVIESSSDSLSSSLTGVIVALVFWAACAAA